MITGLAVGILMNFTYPVSCGSGKLKAVDQ